MRRRYSPIRRQVSDTLLAPSSTSKTNRTARSRTSSGNFLDAAMTPSLRGLGASINPGRFRQWRPQPDDDPSASNLGDLPGPAATEAGAAGGAVRRGRQAAWETGDVRGVAGGPATGGDRRELAGRCRWREELGISWSPGQQQREAGVPAGVYSRQSPATLGLGVRTRSLRQARLPRHSGS